MNSFQGISISESRLLAGAIIFTVMLLIFVAIIVVYSLMLISMRNPKARRRIKNLQKRAENDEGARKQLEKLEAKNKRRKRRNIHGLIGDVFVYVLALGFSVLIIFAAVVPSWTDYALKDYAVYTGEFSVYRTGRYSHIVLGDGTAVTGVGIFDVEDTHGTVVYSKRSGYYLGGEK